MALLFLMALLMILPFVLIHFAEEYVPDSDLLQLLLVVTGIVGVLIAIGVVVQLSTCLFESSTECRNRDQLLLQLLVVYGIAWSACLAAFMWAVWSRTGRSSH